MNTNLRYLISAMCMTAMLSGCGGSPESGSGSSSAGPVATAPGESTTFKIAPGDNEELVTLGAFFAAVDGDTIEFEEGTFHFSTTLVMAHRKDITIKGAGMDKTILDFSNSETPEGISMSHMEGITIEDLTMLDTPGFTIKVSDSDHVVLRNMRAMWTSADGNMNSSVPSTLDVTCVGTASSSTGTYTDSNGGQGIYTTDETNGGYAIYPVLSNHILLDNVVALGASDAGIYVGQSNHVIIKNSLAQFNVAGYEIENTDNADMHDNIGECNTAGFLIFDLPGLNQYGEITRMYDNISRYNNTANFAPGGIVSAVPAGTGLLQLGYDRVEVFNNEIKENMTAGVIIASHELLDGNRNNPDTRMDLYPESIHIHNNIMTDNGHSPQAPEDGAVNQDGSINDSHDSLLPALVVAKNAQAGKPGGGQFIWDGMFEDSDNGCVLAPEFQGLVDAWGKPDYNASHEPDCRYIKYKFDGGGARLEPRYSLCIDDNNTVSSSLNVEEFVNFQDTDPLSPASYDITPHRCEQVYGQTLARLPEAVVEPYVPDENAGSSQSLTPAQIEAICENNTSGIDHEALKHNCNKLSDYNLFQSPTDPRVNPVGNGMRYELTTALFSDYASKHRFVWVPAGTPAVWQEGNSAERNVTINFPVGTVIAKTFSFKDEDAGTENIVETRLLIHRASDNGSFWEGMSYIWEKDANGNPVEAHIAIAGGKQPVSWNYTDPDSGANHTGSTDDYAIPHPNQCGTCHANDDRPAGDAPIGPKVRYLNRPNLAGNQNQLQEWKNAGILTGGPATLTIDNNNIVTNAQRAPRFNVPMDAGNITGFQSNHAEGTAEYDKEIRIRAWLEMNCAHCHNQKGIASSTGVYFNMYRKVDLGMGVCKTPTTAGSSSGGRQFDIVPGSAENSIVEFRVHSEDPGAQMPPIARSIRDDAASALLSDWINTVINSSYDDAGCENNPI